MLRDWDDSGQVYEPKTVKSAYLMNCESTAIGESLSGEKNLVLILEIIRNCGKNVIGENKKMHYVISDIHNDYQKFFYGGKEYEILWF